MAFMAVIKISNNPVSSRTVCLIHFYYIAFWQIVNIRENIRKNYVKCAVLYHYLIIYIAILLYTFIKINAKNREVKKASPQRCLAWWKVSNLKGVLLIKNYFIFFKMTHFFI